LSKMHDIKFMKRLLILPFLYFGLPGFGQSRDSSLENKVVVIRDARLDILARKESELNTAILKTEARIAKGYRLMVLNTSDKDYAFKIRAELLQKFPEQKPYMWFANPYIRIKFGNFRTKEEADVYKKQISKLLNGANIYYLQENIEVDPGKDFDPDSMK
jgi:SPOR domain